MKAFRIGLKQMGAYALLVSIGAAGALLAVKARAALPDQDVLTYTGFLENPDGSPIADAINVRITLWDSAEDSAGTKLCETPAKEMTPVSGRFQVPLPAACVAAVQSNGNVWIETEVDGASLGRTQIGAVPYAVSAGSADAASGALAQQVVPAGAVMPFDLDQCPAGWMPLTAAAGKVVIGTGPGIKRGMAIGADSVVLNESQIPAHSHGIDDPGHQHTPLGTNFITAGGDGASPAKVMTGSASFSFTGLTGSSKTGITGTAAAGGGKPFDNRQASVPLLYCKKM